MNAQMSDFVNEEFVPHMMSENFYAKFAMPILPLFKVKKQISEESVQLNQRKRRIRGVQPSL